MVSDNLFGNTKPGNDLVEEKQGCCFTIVLESGHSLGPLSKVVDNYDDILMISC